MTTLRVGGGTDKGRVRTSNEDQLLMAEPLFAVADGMGGHAGGEVASVTATEALLVAFDGNRSAGGLADAVRDANRAVWELARERPDLRGMGTTLTAAALVQDEDGDDLFAIVNVGDSRAYLLRDGDLDQLTEDHSVPEELRRAGRLSAEEAASDPRRHVLTRVLGVDPDVEVDFFTVTPYRGDRILLASDGLFNEVPDATIRSVLRKLRSPDAAAKELIRLAQEGGGNDNITVVVIDVVDDDDRAEKASAALADEPVVAMPRQLTPTETMAVTDPPPRAAPAQPAGPPGGIEVAVAAPRRSRLPALAFAVVVLLVLGAAAAAVGIYARGSYFVGIQGDEVVIFKGRPGGLLWWSPTVEERTGLLVSDIRPSRAEDLRQGKEEASLGDARRYVRNVREEGAPPGPPPLTPTTAPPVPAP